MTQQLQMPPPGFDNLPTDEKVEYVQALWERVRAELEAAPLPDWLVQLLDERLEAIAADPDAGSPWPEVRDRLLKRL